MLIVIVIIGILAAALIPRLQGAQQRTRDSVRKKDLQDIAYSLEIYREDYWVYPQPKNSEVNCDYSSNCYVFSNNAWWRIDWLEWYMKDVPRDPLNKINNKIGPVGDRWPWRDNNYVYAYWNVYPANSCFWSDYYTLWGQVENRKDPDRNEVRNYSVMNPRTCELMNWNNWGRSKYGFGIVLKPNQLY